MDQIDNIWLMRSKAEYIFLIAFLLNAIPLLPVFGQGNANEAFLLRKHIDKDSTWIVENSDCYFVENTGMKDDHFGWFQMNEMVSKNTNLLIFEANTFGSLQLILELPKEIGAIKLDTVATKSYQLINHYYGYLRRDIARKSKTVDMISGILLFARSSNNKIFINGKIEIDTQNPITHQEIIFDHSEMKVQTIPELLEVERIDDLERKRQDTIQFNSYWILHTERAKFYDSVFSLSKYPKNNIQATINRKVNFEFKLDNSYVLLNAKLTDSDKHDLVELLGGNILASIQGKKKVFVFHSFYDPEKNSIDDEINFSLNIEIDSIVTGRVYELDGKNKNATAKLSFWHYGPNGAVISSKEETGIVTITNDNVKTTIGIVDLRFRNCDKSTIWLKGNFELPKLDISNIVEVERRANTKLRKYLSDQKR